MSQRIEVDPVTGLRRLIMFDKQHGEWAYPISNDSHPVPFQKAPSPFGDDARKKAKDKTRKKRREAAKRRDNWSNKEEAAVGKSRTPFNKSAMMLVVAKGVAAGHTSKITKREWYEEMQKQSDALREPNMTRESSFSRFITTNPDGQLLYKAYRKASGEDYTGEDDIDDTVNDDFQDDPGYQKLCQAAQALMRDNPSLSFPAAFSICYAANPNLAAISKRYTLAKLGPGGTSNNWTPKLGPSLNQRTVDQSNGQAGDQHSSLDQYNRLMQLANETKRPGQTIEQRFAELYTGKSQDIPGQDDGKRGKDQPTKLQSEKPLTALRRQTHKAYNLPDYPGEGSGWSR